jgi:hypothetical protein
LTEAVKDREASESPHRPSVVATSSVPKKVSKNFSNRLLTDPSKFTTKESPSKSKGIEREEMAFYRTNPQHII